MTLDEAKAALELCPPEDDTNPNVPGLAEALELVASNPEMAAWWEQEKNFTQLFARKLVSLNPPIELMPTIMRGGATIFFASRLIADTAEDEPAEIQPLPEIPIPPRSMPVAETAAERESADKSTPAGLPSYFWRAALVLICVVGLLVLAGLFWLEYGLAKKVQKTSPSQSFLRLEPLVMESITSPAPPAPVGQTLAEMKKYLDDNHAPNPPVLPALVSQPPADAVVSVTVEYWNTHTVTRFTVQSGANSSHLFILNANEFPADDQQIEDLSREKGAYNEHIWNAGGYFYIEMTPLAAKP